MTDHNAKEHESGKLHEAVDSLMKDLPPDGLEQAVLDRVSKRLSSLPRIERRRRHRAIMATVAVVVCTVVVVCVVLSPEKNRSGRPLPELETASTSQPSAPKPPAAEPATPPDVPSSKPKYDDQPTILAYRLALAKSPEDLDRLLDRHARRQIAVASRLRSKAALDPRLMQ